MSEPILSIVITGKPQPQGSAQAWVVYKDRKRKIPVRRADGSIAVNVTTDNAELKAWRKRAAEAVRAVYHGKPIGGHGFTVEYVSYFKRREADWGTGRNAHL